MNPVPFAVTMALSTSALLSSHGPPQLFASIVEVRLCVTAWLWNYSHERPSMALGGITPEQRLGMPV